MRTCARALVVSLVLGVSATDLRAQVAQPANLAFATLEDLLQIEVTSAGRKEQHVADIPAAIYVLTQDDIRRSGIRTLPELFRLVPGMQVAQINSSTWAVSVRGFNGVFSNKLLVLVDGRTLYNRTYTGVTWNAQDILLENIERIEVIRGPGAAIWGANAVNGVINIITKSSADTQGLFAQAGSGTLDGQGASIRYGGASGTTTYRLSSQWADHGDTTFGGGVSARDSWKTVSGGGRLDRTQGAHAFLVEGSAVDLTTRQTGARGPDTLLRRQEGSVLGRWTFSASGGRSLQIQSFLNASRERPNQTATEPNSEKIADVDVEYHARLGARHDFVVGGGYRYSSNIFRSVPQVSLDPSDSSSTLANAFAQDEIALGARLSATLGSKVERNSVTGWNVQPTARAVWRLGSSQQVWAAASRALRSPSPFDLGARGDIPVAPINGLPTVLEVLGNPAYQTEKLRDAEAGYRISPSATTAIDVTAFRGHYSDLPMLQPSAPTLDLTTGAPRLVVPVILRNLLEADTTGAEVSARWMPTARFDLDGSYSYVHVQQHDDRVTGGAFKAPTYNDITPQHQWQLHSTGRPTARLELSASLYRVGRVSELAIAAYTRADVRLEQRISGRLSLAVAGQNLTSREHAESSGDGSATGVAPTLIPRSVGVSLVWRP